MKPRKRHELREEHVDSWLISYADMVTLLLAFFIIFVSTSEPKQEMLVEATRGMKERFGMLSLDTPFDQVYRSVQGVVARDSADQYVSITKLNRSLQIEIGTVQIFKEGTAEIAPKQISLLKKIVESLEAGKLIDYSVVVEGHTNNLPPPLDYYSNNWELSAARAARIAAFMAENGIEAKRMRAVGYADTIAVSPNTDHEGRAIAHNQTRNERVVIRVVKK